MFETRASNIRRIRNGERWRHISSQYNIVYKKGVRTKYE